MEMKDAMRESGIVEVIRTCQNLVALYHMSEPPLAAYVLEALRRYVNWADISLLATDKCGPAGPLLILTANCKL